MLNAGTIRIAVALTASLAVHGMLLGLDTGREQSFSCRAPAGKVTFSLVPRQPEPVPAEAGKARKNVKEVVRQVKPVPAAAVKKAEPESAGKGRKQQVPAPADVVPVKRTEPPPDPRPEKRGDTDGAPAEAHPAGREQEKRIPPQDPPAALSGLAGVSGTTGPADVVMARPLYRINPPPPYPLKARRRNLQGTVLLEVAVSAEGTVEQLRIRDSCGHGILDRAALAAVRDWVFEPGSRNGVHVGMTVLVPVRFQLD